MLSFIGLKQLEEEKAYSSPEYAAIEANLSAQFTCRLVPRPDFWDTCIQQQNKKIYDAMQVTIGFVNVF
jgi:hypothetical protein